MARSRGGWVPVPTAAGHEPRLPAGVMLGWSCGGSAQAPAARPLEGPMPHPEGACPRQAGWWSAERLKCPDLPMQQDGHFTPRGPELGPRETRDIVAAGRILYNSLRVFGVFGRSGGIRTHDPQSPRLVRYQTALRSGVREGLSEVPPLVQCIGAGDVASLPRQNKP